METNGMKKSIFLKISAITFLMSGVVFCGCSNSNDEPIEPVGPKTYTLTIEASKGGSAETRVLEEKEGSLVSTWETSDKVYVTKSRESSSCGLLQPKTSGTTATLSGTITGTFAQEDGLTFQYPRQTIDYTGQIGTLADISAKYDYSVATAKVDNVSGNVIAIKDFSGFTNQQAIVKFTLQDKSGNAISATSLTISASGLKTSNSVTGDITVTPTSATNALYVALSGIENKTVTLIAKTATDIYIYEKSGVTFNDEKYYEITVKMDNMRSIPLTFEAKNDGAVITFHNNLLTDEYVEYRLNNDESWTKYTGPITLVKAGDKIRFHGNNNSYYPNSNASFFSFTGECYVFGNIMSLISAEGFSNSTVFDYDYNPSAFRELFKNNDNLLSHSEKPLILPATTLVENCYQSMFEGCTKLERAPVLPAPTLAPSCYYQMFKGCTNLNYIKCLATSFASGSTTDWVVGVNGNGTFVKDPNADWSSMSEGSGIPSLFTLPQNNQ